MTEYENGGSGKPGNGECSCGRGACPKDIIANEIGTLGCAIAKDKGGKGGSNPGDMLDPNDPDVLIKITERYVI
ncbi:MAG: hypothetical protein LBQ11_02485 [Candidatus Nomurabacteria bacterium]|jgi:hypothetical protein|nr:hypothetical protein [Candidatus Nomurabacteria bacterium]